MHLLPSFAEIPFRIITCEIVNSQRWCGVTSRIETVAQIQSLLTGNGIGHDAVSTIGGADTVWRIYEDHTAPLLRRFLTQTDLGYTKEYNGSAQTLTYGELQAKYAKGIGITDGSTVAAEAQVLATATDVGSVDYASTELARMLWSNQQGYPAVPLTHDHRYRGDQWLPIQHCPQEIASDLCEGG